METIAEDAESEYELDKAKKKYAGLGDSIQIVHLEKSHRGLGISLAGHKDRNRMAVFVCGLNPNGTAYKTGGIQVGDEILEVNLMSLSASKPTKTTPVKQNLDSATSTHLPVPENSLSVLTPHLPAASLSPSASPAPSLRKSSSGKIAEEPPVDPTVCPIVPGKEVTIEIVKDKLGLGLGIIGGCDTPHGTVIVHEVYPGGAAAKDGRLQPGDQILELNSEDFRKLTHVKALEKTWLTQTKVTMVVYRNENVNPDDLLEVFDVEIIKKPGKGLGLSVSASSKGRGVFISEVVHGGAAEVDGRLAKGDYVLEINGENLRDCDVRTAAVAVKICSGRVNLKIGRIKCKNSHNSANGKNACTQTMQIVSKSAVHANGARGEDALDADRVDDLIEGCFPGRKSSVLRNFARSLSIRRRHNN